MTLQQMRYILSDERAARKIKLRELEEKAGIKFSEWDRSIYRKGGTNIKTFIAVAEAMGYEITLVKKGEQA